WFYGFLMDVGVICQSSWYNSDLDLVPGYPDQDRYKIFPVHPEIVDYKTVGQYIGKRDKNEKEIYEGDVVEVENVRGIVRYREDLARFDALGIPPSSCWFMMEVEIGMEWENAIVIGNIYDNPELLKDEGVQNE
ncbi:MAG: YopX family protein, partial [Candidatus Heimdallarchaeaceae archaeon]